MLGDLLPHLIAVAALAAACALWVFIQRLSGHQPSAGCCGQHEHCQHSTKCDEAPDT